MGNKPNPKQLKWERIPNEYKRQLYALVACDHYHAIREGRASLENAKDSVCYALEEVENLFSKEGNTASEARQWLEEQKKASLECYSVEHRKYTEGGATYDRPASGFDDSRGRAVFVWKGSSISALQDIRTPDEDLKGGKAKKQRWEDWIKWKAAVWFFHNMVDNVDELPDEAFGPMTFAPLLVTSLPVDEDQTERALRYAKELTAFGAKGRKDYRLRHYVEGGPNIPVRLTMKVGAHLGVGPRRAADILYKGGFKLPDDLGQVMRPRSGR